MATENLARNYMLRCSEAWKYFNCTPLLSVGLHQNHCSWYSSMALLLLSRYLSTQTLLYVCYAVLHEDFFLFISLCSYQHIRLQSHHVSFHSLIVHIKSSINLFVELFVTYGSMLFKHFFQCYCFLLSSWFNNFILLLRVAFRVVCFMYVFHRLLFRWMDLCKRCLCYVWTHMENVRGFCSYW